MIRVEIVDTGKVRPRLPVRLVSQATITQRFQNYYTMINALRLSMAVERARAFWGGR
jgi:hypothetical protein